jgi:hypothetical protein
MRPDAGSDGEAVSALAGFDKKTWVPQLGLASETRNVCPAWGNASAHGETACI